MKPILICLAFILPVALKAQQSAMPANTARIDSLATTIKYRNDLARLTNELTGSYTDKTSKARAIFRWITDNIGYDYQFYNKHVYKGKELETFKCDNNKDCAAKRAAWEMDYIDNVLKSKEAVCMGYAMLFKKMCDLVGIQSEAVGGYVRTTHYQVGTAGNLSHMWNVVMLDDSTWHFLDPTWAAGGCSTNEEGKILSYNKHFNNYYWLTPAEDFLRNHFPKNPKWVLAPNYTKEKFAANPYYDGHILPHIKLLAPQTGIIATQKGDTLHFRFEYEQQLKKIQINSNLFRNPDVWTYEQSGNSRIRKPDPIALQRQQYIPFTQEGNTYTFDYPVTDNALYFIDLLFDTQRVMRFNVITKK